MLRKLNQRESFQKAIMPSLRAEDLRAFIEPTTDAIKGLRELERKKNVINK